jgi:hypothetical protein
MTAVGWLLLAGGFVIGVVVTFAGIALLLWLYARATESELAADRLTSIAGPASSTMVPPPPASSPPAPGMPGGFPRNYGHGSAAPPGSCLDAPPYYPSGRLTTSAYGGPVPAGADPSLSGRHAGSPRMSPPSPSTGSILTDPRHDRSYDWDDPY